MLKNIIIESAGETIMKKSVKNCMSPVVLAFAVFAGSMLTSCGTVSSASSTKTDEAPPSSSALPDSSTGSSSSTQTVKPSFCTVSEIYDWGPAVSKVIINLGRTAAKDSVGTDTFKVHVVRRELRQGITIDKKYAEGDRTITKAYVSNQDGSAADSGSYVTLEMEIGPEAVLGSTMNFDPASNRNVYVKCTYSVTQQKDIISDSGKISGIAIPSQSKDIRKLVDDYKTGSFTSNEITLTYASYAPKDSQKHPLIVWLHGLGEAGTDPTVPISSNKAGCFALPEFQSYFGGAYVLVPQCPSMWLPGREATALMALIKDYVSKNKIDTNRIYLGGDSNGGYMTMEMIRSYPDYFAAAMPACEAMPNNRLSQNDIHKMKKMPIWFTTAKADKVVNPDLYTVATYNRLVKAGAKDIHFSYFDKVIDTTGLYKKADGTPYEYNGHFSYFYVFNNQCIDTINGKKTTIMQWLASQDKSKQK